MNATHKHGDMKLEVDVIPVADVDRSKDFYQRLGWRLDADFSFGEGVRVVQLTPPGSPSSIMFGKMLTNGAPGSPRELFLVVDDVEAARKDLLEHGVNVSEVFHFAGGIRFDTTETRVPGRHPQNRSYLSFVTFNDPDGNTFIVQEVTTRLPGRGFSNDVGTLTALLREAEERHGAYEKSAPKHHWSNWYGAYIAAREQGRTPDEAAADAAIHMKGIIQ